MAPEDLNLAISIFSNNNAIEQAMEILYDRGAQYFNHAERAGYHIVIHVHDEPVAEVPLGWGSVAEFESIINVMPAWARGLPVKATGGWRGQIEMELSDD